MAHQKPDFSTVARYKGSNTCHAIPACSLGVLRCNVYHLHCYHMQIMPFLLHFDKPTRKRVMTTFVSQHLKENVRLVFCNNLRLVSLATNVPIEFIDLMLLFHTQVFKKI